MNKKICALSRDKNGNNVKRKISSGNIDKRKKNASWEPSPVTSILFILIRSSFTKPLVVVTSKVSKLLFFNSSKNFK